MMSISSATGHSWEEEGASGSKPNNFQPQVMGLKAGLPGWGYLVCVMQELKMILSGLKISAEVGARTAPGVTTLDSQVGKISSLNCL